MLTVDVDSPLDKLVEAVPDLVNKIVDTVDSSILKTSQRLKVQNPDNKQK